MSMAPLFIHICFILCPDNNYDVFIEQKRWETEINIIIYM